MSTATPAATRRASDWKNRQLKSSCRFEMRDKESSPEQLRAEADEATLGVGIPSMRQRLRQLGGHLTIESNSQGTAITATVPLRAERRQASRAALA